MWQATFDRRSVSSKAPNRHHFRWWKSLSRRLQPTLLSEFSIRRESQQRLGNSESLVEAGLKEPGELVFTRFFSIESEALPPIPIVDRSSDKKTYLQSHVSPGKQRAVRKARLTWELRHALESEERRLERSARHAALPFSASGTRDQS